MGDAVGDAVGDVVRPFVLLAPLLALIASPAFAQDLVSSADAPVITVWGNREAEIGRAFAASEGEVGFGRFVDRPLLRAGELAEVVPGLAATQHSGTGKANQYFLRGFNLDHGTDFSISMDGVPLNLRTNAHGQGYLDINFMIPEIVERIAYRKGLAYAVVGDFSAAGSATFSTFARLPASFAQIEAGENNWRRFVGGASFGELGYVAFDYTGDDGPWVAPENLEKLNGFARFNFGAVSVSGGAYHAEWNATDQIPLRAVESGQIGPLDEIDDDVGGVTERIWLNAQYEGEAGLRANVFAMRYRLDLFSDFTYFLDDPVNGDEFEQREARMIYGAAAAKTLSPLGAWTPRIGAEVRFDRIDPVGLYHTAGRTRVSTVREDRVDQESVGVFAELDGDFDRLRVNLGLRADAMGVDVRAGDTRNSGEADDALIAPKAALAWRFSDNFEGYVSAGRGFHSNDARGATITVDPATGDPADRVPLLVEATGADAGLRFERDNVSAAVSLFWLDLDSELVYVGDAGATEASDASRRSGVEVTATWAPTRWLTLDGAVAATRARFRDVPSNADRIPLATEYVVTGGAVLRFSDAWTGAVTLRHLGPAPLIEDNSARSDASTVVNGRVAWRHEGLELALEALNILDSDDADITYFYASRLPGEVDDGVEDVHYHPIPPRSLRLQARKTF